jgi:hypothetical protein
MVFGPSFRPPGDEPAERSESPAAAERVRVALTLTREDFDRLNKVADEHGLTVGEVLQRAIATALFLQGQVDKRSKILMQDRDGRLSEFAIL